MNKPPDKKPLTDIDPQVSAEYRALADETAPQRLDRAVLRRAAVRPGARFSIDGWLRPLSFVAVAGLSLVLVLSMSVIEPDVPTSVPPTSTAAMDDATGPTRRKRSAAPTAEALRQEKAAASAQAKPAAGTADRDLAPAATFEREIAVANERLQDVEIQAMPTASAPGNIDVGACTAEQMATAAAWWGCVESLERAGQSAAADSELRALIQAFPTFEPPTPATPRR